jgi:hypothetical protein
MVRQYAGIVVPALALLDVLSYSILFSDIQPSVHVVWMAVLSLLAIACWYRTPNVVNLLGAATTGALTAAAQLQQVAVGLQGGLLSQSLPWLAGGAACLLAGGLISSIKAGTHLQIGRKLTRMNDYFQRIRPSQ